MLRRVALPVAFPVPPMLAKLSGDLPAGDGWLFEPKWDGFRALVFKDGEEVRIQSRDEKPLERYFPELMGPLRAGLPERCVLDGEIVIATGSALDFYALLQRIHPAASRVAELARVTPASYVAFDLLALGDEDLRSAGQAARRARLVEILPSPEPPLHITPMTRDRAVAADWFGRFEGAGLDGVMAKADDLPYSPGKRAMLKIKHARTADCVVAGFRWFKGGKDQLLGSLLLGLYDDADTLHHVGIASSFTMQARKDLVAKLQPLRERALEGHPWADWRDFEGGAQRKPSKSRWTQNKDLSWEPLRLERVCEVKYDHMQGTRFRHATHLVRWRDDKPVRACRYDQLEVTPAYELQRIFGHG